MEKCENCEDKELCSTLLRVLRKIGGTGAENGPRRPPSCPVFVAEVVPAEANKIIQILSQRLPLDDGLIHLKRIRRIASDDESKNYTLEVLLCRQEVWLLRDADLDNCLKQFALKTRLHHVPAVPPLSKEELIQWRQLWPLSYRPGRERYIPPDCQELRNMYNHLQYVSEQAIAVQGDHCKQFAILVHPATNIRVAEGRDSSFRNSNRNDNSRPVNSTLKHAVMNCIESFSIPHGDSAKVRRKSGATEKGSPNERGANSPLRSDQYLGTGLDCYMLREPCVMCAMALVHSRIRRVVFVAYNEDVVSGLSDAKIHNEPSLNHRFDAFYIPIDQLSGIDRG